MNSSSDNRSTTNTPSPQEVTFEQIEKAITTLKAQAHARERNSTWEKFSEGLTREIDALHKQNAVSMQAVSSAIGSLKKFRNSQLMMNSTLANLGSSISEMDAHHRQESSSTHMPMQKPEETKKPKQEDPQRHCATMPN